MSRNEFWTFLAKSTRIGNMQTVQIDRFGRILIPKSIREELNLVPNTTLELRLVDGDIAIHPRLSGEIRKENGVYVWTGADPIEKSLDDLIQETRAERNT